MRKLRHLWRNLILRRQVDDDIDAELRATLDLIEDEGRAAGLTPDAARRSAVLALGRPEPLKERIRDVRAGAGVETWIQDLRYALRLLRRGPMFAAFAVTSLALGIGATTTIFTVANGLLLRSASGVSNPDSLVDIVRETAGTFGRGIAPSSYEEYLDLQRRLTTLEGLVAYQLDLTPLGLRSGAGAERVFSSAVSTNYFDVLGVTPATGRGFGAQASDAEAVVVLSHDLWSRMFAADPQLVGQAIWLNGRPFTVAGIAPQAFRGTGLVAPDLWLPVATSQALTREGGPRPLFLIGRLRAGVTGRQMAAEILTVGATPTADESARPETRWSVTASSPIPSMLRGVATAFIGLLMILVSLVLVIACANLAGVLLARATGRRREIAVRVAIGAGRKRLVRQLLTETAVLFAIGGALGVLLARGMTRLLLATLPAFPLPVNLSLPLDWRVLVFAAIVSLIAAILSGLTPALHASGTDVVSALKDESQGPSDRLRLRSAFVVAQVAFSVVLVVAAGLFGRALGRMAAVDDGFDARGVEVLSLDLSMGGYSQATGPEFARDLLDRLRRLPGVASAALADKVPGGPVQVEAMKKGRGAAPPKSGPPASLTAVTVVEPGYFPALRIQLLSGRDFTSADNASGQPVAVVGESTARRLWPGADPLGRALPSDPARVVIGVVRDLKRNTGGRGLPVDVVYVPLAQRYRPQITVFARSATGGRLAAVLRQTVASINPNLVVLDVRALDDPQAGPAVTQLRVAAMVSASVGGLGLLLASIGIYGVTAYAVSQRTREIGIRLSLGARRADVIRLVVGRTLTLVAAGCGIGLVLSAAAGRVVARMSVGASPFDAAVFGGAALLFLAIGSIACYMPVRHATRISAVEALRYE